jgi:hypothetical protein
VEGNGRGVVGAKGGDGCLVKFGLPPRRNKHPLHPSQVLVTEESPVDSMALQSCQCL